MKKCSYHVYKVFDSKNKIHICEFETRNEARRLEQILLNSKHADWWPEIFTEMQESTMKIKGLELLGSHGQDCAIEFGAVEIIHIGGKRYILRKANGDEQKFLADEGIGSSEFESDPAGFEAAWESDW
jgi:hypothetical protein